MARSVAVSFALKQPAARRFVTLFALLAFFLHGIAVQGHLHQPAPVSAIVAASDLPAPLKKTDPADQNHCRPCQELAQAGAFVGPAASVLPASLGFIAAVFVTAPLLAGAFAPAFSWQSRAPPHH